MAKTWCPTNFSQFYVKGTSYCKIKGIPIHYKDVSLQWEIKILGAKIDPPPPFRLFSDETVN